MRFSVAALLLFIGTSNAFLTSPRPSRSLEAVTVAYYGSDDGFFNNQEFHHDDDDDDAQGFNNQQPFGRRGGNSNNPFQKNNDRGPSRNWNQSPNNSRGRGMMGHDDDDAMDDPLSRYNSQRHVSQEVIRNAPYQQDNQSARPTSVVNDRHMNHRPLKDVTDWGRSSNEQYNNEPPGYYGQGHLKNPTVFSTNNPRSSGFSSSSQRRDHHRQQSSYYNEGHDDMMPNNGSSQRVRATHQSRAPPNASRPSRGMQPPSDYHYENGPQRGRRGGGEYNGSPLGRGGYDHDRRSDFEYDDDPRSGGFPRGHHPDPRRSHLNRRDYDDDDDPRSGGFPRGRSPGYLSDDRDYYDDHRPPRMHRDRDFYDDDDRPPRGLLAIPPTEAFMRDNESPYRPRRRGRRRRGGNYYDDDDDDDDDEYYNDRGLGMGDRDYRGRSPRRSSRDYHLDDARPRGNYFDDGPQYDHHRDGEGYENRRPYGGRRRRRETRFLESDSALDYTREPVSVCVIS